MDRFIGAFYYSMGGFAHVAAHEKAFRLELMLSMIAVPIAFLLTSEPSSLLLLFIAHMAVLIVELLNTGLEAVCDEISKDYSLNIKIAKDCGSAAVFLTLSLCGIAWLFVISQTVLIL